MNYLIEEHIKSLITNCRKANMGGENRHPTGFKVALTNLLDCLNMIKREHDHDNKIDIDAIEKRVRLSVSIPGEPLFSKKLSTKDPSKIAQDIITKYFQ